LAIRYAATREAALTAFAKSLAAGMKEKAPLGVFREELAGQ
jgi:hypothetical protein